MRRATLCVFLATFAACVLACSGAGDGLSNGALSTNKATAQKLTMAQYNAVREGMTYRQACEAIGFAGEESSRVAIGSTATVMYTWKGDFGANMNATFQDDSLISKAQFGLK